MHPNLAVNDLAKPTSTYDILLGGLGILKPEKFVLLHYKVKYTHGQLTTVARSNIFLRNSQTLLQEAVVNRDTSARGR